MAAAHVDGAGVPDLTGDTLYLSKFTLFDISPIHTFYYLFVVL